MTWKDILSFACLLFIATGSLRLAGFRGWQGMALSLGIAAIAWGFGRMAA